MSVICEAPYSFNRKLAAAAAKSRQSCLTLCDPTDGSPPGSHPWDSPGKNTGVGCHFLLQCMKVKSESEVVQSYPTLRDPIDCSLPGSSVHGISQARVLEWVAIAFSERMLESFNNASNKNLNRTASFFLFHQDKRIIFANGHTKTEVIMVIVEPENHSYQQVGEKLN